ncbi:MAG: type 4a pilus biogenesis protein PilO [Acidobacteriota bacterium]
MESLKNLGFKGQMGLMAFLMIAIGCLAWFVWPNFGQMRTEIQQKKDQFAKLNDEIEEARNLEKKLPELERRIESLEAQLAELRTIIPPVRDDSEIIRKFEELAGRSRLNIQRIVPQRQVEKEFYREYPITLDVLSTYHDLGLFFSRLAQESRIFNVTSLVMRQQLTPSTSIHGNLKAMTFIYNEEVPLLQPEEDKKKKGRR